MTPASILLWAGLAASTGLGYQPIGPAAGVTVRTETVDVRAVVDVTPKQTTGRGWNASLEAVTGRRVLAGARLVAWSGGPWRKASASLMAGVRVAPGVRMLAEATAGQSSEWGGWSRAVGVEAEHGRVRASVKVVRYTQAKTNVGVVADVSVRVWRLR